MTQEYDVIRDRLLDTAIRIINRAGRVVPTSAESVKMVAVPLGLLDELQSIISLSGDLSHEALQAINRKFINDR